MAPAKTADRPEAKTAATEANQAPPANGNVIDLATNKKFLTRIEVLGADDVRTEDIFVEQWGGWLKLRNLSGTERDAYESSMLSGDMDDRSVNTENLRAKLVAKSVVDPTNFEVRLFSDADVIALGKKSAAALQTVFDACQTLSALKGVDLEKIKADLGKGQSASSGSA